MAENASALITPERLHETLRGLTEQFYATENATDRAVKACALVHLFLLLDSQLSHGAELPSAWADARPVPFDTNAG